MIAPRHSTRQRRNPRAPTTPKHPTVVLVRRFDPSGEELSRWEVLYRDDEGVTFFSPPEAKAAALNPPLDADLHIGDLIATMPAEAAGHDVVLCLCAPGRSWTDLLTDLESGP